MPAAHPRRSQSRSALRFTPRLHRWIEAKVAAACQFAEKTGNEAVIGSLSDIDKIVAGNAGTRVRSS